MGVAEVQASRLIKLSQQRAESNGESNGEGWGLDKALEVLLLCSRSDHGRNELANLAAVPFLLDYVASLHHYNNSIIARSSISSEAPDENYYKLLYTLLKILRNLCAGELINQNLFLEKGGLEITGCVIKSITSPSSGVSLNEVQRLNNLPSCVADVVQMILQLLGNVSLAGDKHQSSVWQAHFPGIFKELVFVQNPKICDPLCMVIYTCCNANHHRLKELCGSAGASIVAGILRTSNAVSIEGDWLERLLMVICFEEPYFPCLFYSLREQELSSPDKVEYSGEAFTPEHGYLLCMISVILNRQLEGGSQLINLREWRHVTVDMATFLVEIVRKAETSANLKSKTPPSLPTGLPAIDVLGFSLHILRDLCAWEDPNCMGMSRSSVTATPRLSVVDSLISSGLVQFMLHLLHKLGPPESVRKATMQASLENSDPAMENDDQSEPAMDVVDASRRGNGAEDRYKDASTSQDRNRGNTLHADLTVKMCPYRGYRRDIVSVLANATFRRKHVQDQIRERGGIFLLLQQCVVDEDNPYLREWGLWAVRNLLEGNLENQQKVAELELQNSVNTPEITQMGLRVEVDQKSRRPKLVNISAEGC